MTWARRLWSCGQRWLGGWLWLGLCVAVPCRAAPNPMTRDEIVANAKTVVGFSYFWGGSAWSPGSTNIGQCIPLSADGCPNCQHKGPYGADCSGFVAKAWQIDTPVALDVPYHPYSTATFASGTAWWTKPAKADAKK